MFVKNREIKTLGISSSLQLSGESRRFISQKGEERDQVRGTLRTPEAGGVCTRLGLRIRRCITESLNCVLHKAISQGQLSQSQLTQTPESSLLKECRRLASELCSGLNSICLISQEPLGPT